MWGQMIWSWHSIVQWHDSHSDTQHLCDVQLSDWSAPLCPALWLADLMSVMIICDFDHLSVEESGQLPVSPH